MSDTAETEKKSKPWQWPGEWMRDEKFWRDVGSRTIAGLIVVGASFVFAVGAGYIQRPDVIDVIAIVAMMGTVALVPIIFLLSGFYKMGKLRRTVPILGGLMFVLLLIGAIATWASGGIVTF